MKTVSRRFRSVLFVLVLVLAQAGAGSDDLLPLMGRETVADQVEQGVCPVTRPTEQVGRFFDGQRIPSPTALPWCAAADAGGTWFRSPWIRLSRARAVATLRLGWVHFGISPRGPPDGEPQLVQA